VRHVLTPAETDGKGHGEVDGEGDAVDEQVVDRRAAAGRRKPQEVAQDDDRPREVRARNAPDEAPTDLVQLRRAPSGRPHAR